MADLFRHGKPLVAVMPTGEEAPWYLKPYLDSFGCNHTDWLKFLGSFFLANAAVVTPFDGDKYTDSRALFYDQFSDSLFPLMIIHCSTTDDVVLAVEFAMSHQIKVTPRSARHSTAGFSSRDKYMCIDVSKMKGVYVDTQAQIAIVGGGCTWDEVYREVERRGFHAVGGGCPIVGVAGFSLGGGYGFTSRNFGLGCDNIVEVTVVTASPDADKRIVVANESNHPNILRAHKGGMGGNFGVVTHFKLRIYPYEDNMYGMLLMWPIDVAAKVLHTYLSKYTNSPDTDPKCGIQGMLLTLDRKKYIVLMALYVGTEAEAHTTLQPLLAINGVDVRFSGSGPYSYLNSSLLDYVGSAGTPIGGVEANQYKLCRYIEHLPSMNQLQVMIDHFKIAPHDMNVFNFESYGGRIANPTSSNHSFVHRTYLATLVCNSYYDRVNVSYDQAKEWAYSFVITDEASLFNKHSYQNYPNEDYPDFEIAYFGPPANGVFEFLQRVKLELDPYHVFKYPHGIYLPSGEQAQITEVHGERKGRTLHDYQNGKADLENLLRAVANISPAATRTKLIQEIRKS